MAVIWQKIMNFKKTIIFLLVLAGTAQVGLYLYQTKNKPANTVRTMTVERGDLVSLVAATGTITPVNSVNVSSKITGLIKEVKVNENDHVTAGQILTILDDTHLRALVNQAAARLANSTANLQRAERLIASGAVPFQQVDTARMEYDVARAAYDDAISNLNDTIIRAPIDGIVIGKPVPAGQTVAPGISTPMVLMTIADMSMMQIETQVDESDIGRVAVGQKVTFTVDAYPGKTFTGTVSNVSNKANIQQNVVYYPVIIDVNDSTGLKPTMTARVTVSVGEVKNALIVPLTVVKENKGQRYIQILKDGQPQNAIVTIGLTGDDRVEIVSGLKEGDQILMPQSKTQGQSPGSMRGIFGR